MHGRSQVDVVLLDDQKDLRLLVGMLMEADDRFSLVGEAQDGESGLAMILDRAPDLVVLDLHMPGRDGIELLERLRQGNPGLPVVVVLSAGNAEILRPVALDHGAAGFIEKTVHLGTQLLDDLWAVWSRTQELGLESERQPQVVGA